MHIFKTAGLACPLDQLPLEQQQGSLVCSRGHTYDIARQGYVNLLPAQHRPSRDPGDSKEMVQARHDFLSAGWYQPVSECLNQLVAERLAAHSRAAILDAGCGEGYYLWRLQQHLQSLERFESLQLIGMDISRAAVQQAAKRSRDIAWVVANNVQPPVLPRSLDCVICVFGFPSFDGFSRVLKPGGHVILVEPGEAHLQQLREIIYTSLKQKQPRLESHDDFHLCDEQRLQFQLQDLDNTAIRQLLSMTPHLHRAGHDGREAAMQLAQLSTQVDMLFRVYRKTSHESS